MNTKEKWLCGRRFSGVPYKVKQVFVTESEHYFMVQGIQDEETTSLLGFKKKIRKSDRVLFDTATEAVQAQIDNSERKISDYQEKVRELIVDLRQLDVLKVPR